MLTVAKPIDLAARGRDDDWSPEPAKDADRLRALDVERVVLAGALSGLLAEVRPWLVAEHFATDGHQRIFEAACALADAGDPVDIAGVSTQLRKIGRLAQVGGAAAVTDLVATAPAMAPANMRTHGRTVRDLAVRRQLGVLAQLIKARVDGDSADVDALIADAHAQLEGLSATLAENEVSIRADAAVARVWTELEKLAQAPEVSAYATGFDRLDRILAGLPKDLVVLAAPPGMGKTSLATAVSVNIAKRGGAVFFASLETTETPLVTRILCAEARVDVKRMLLGQPTPTDLSRLVVAANTISALPLWTDTESTMSVGDLWQKCRRLQLQLAREAEPRRLELVAVDYAQLLKEPRNARTRQEAVAANVRALQKMAHQLGCTVLALSQVNNAHEDRKDRRPQLRDLAESSELRKCARTVLLLYRPDYYDHDDQPGVAEVHVAKQSNGPTGLARLHFDAGCVRFDNLAEGWAHDKEPRAQPPTSRAPEGPPHWQDGSE